MIEGKTENNSCVPCSRPFPIRYTNDAPQSVHIYRHVLLWILAMTYRGNIHRTYITPTDMFPSCVWSVSALYAFKDSNQWIYDLIISRNNLLPILLPPHPPPPVSQLLVLFVAQHVGWGHSSSSS